MSRVQIKLPETFVFHTDIAVQIGDINYGNHLANDAVLRLCHEARLRFLHALGFSEMDVAGVGLIMADAAIACVKNGMVFFDYARQSIANTPPAFIQAVAAPIPSQE